MAFLFSHTLPPSSLLPPFNPVNNNSSTSRLSISPPISRRRDLSRKIRRLSPTVPGVTTPSSPPVSTEKDTSEFRESESASSSSSSDTFSWRDHWYPVSLIEDLDPRRPTPFQLLNRDIVLWKDTNSGDWVAFDDRCPHRLAPLSEGRIDENGCLQCSYHGWSFDRKGSCVRIPQASAEGPESRAVLSSRACVARLPTMVSQGLLFVWPDERGLENAMASEAPRLPDDFQNPDFSTVTIQRDLFYAYDTLMENVSDPSHIEFAHHKVTGRRSRAKPLPFKLESSGASGFAGADSGNPRISAEFIAPCYYVNKIEIDTRLPIFGDQKWVIWICSFNIPMALGRPVPLCVVPEILFSSQCQVINGGRYFEFHVIMQLVPRWYEHWTSNLVYDGDMIVLQGQEKIFLSKSMEASTDINEQYTKVTFTPTQADRLVLAFRNWLRRYGNGQPDWFGVANQQSLPSTVLSKREMLDRFEQHTLKCSSCKGAYDSFRSWQKVLVGAAVVLCAFAGIPSEIQVRILLAASAIVSAAMAYALHELQKNFVFVDYVHADID
ncbi:hypothetical protein KSP39_PZI015031 [Platanthera zijinensis]|uniref:Rieske domain-containing protein n=1 Tax=Platanthera zijinensis TaxID=2320716 RepID=A0AAP0G2K7_9ASPA